MIPVFKKSQFLYFRFLPVFFDNEKDYKRITEIDHCFVLYTFRDIEDSLTDELHIYVNDEDHQSDVKQEKHSAVVKQ